MDGWLPLSSKLFFGFEMKNGIYIALPEKALLDEVYFVVRGKVTFDLDELDTKKLLRKILKDYSQRFPTYVKSYLRKL